MVVRVEGAYDTGYRFSERTVEEGVASVVEQTSGLHDLVRDDGPGRIASDVGIAVARSRQRALVVHRRLYRELVSGLVSVAPLFSDGDYLAAELMADDDGVLFDVVGDSLVVAALHRRLV